MLVQELSAAHEHVEAVGLCAQIEAIRLEIESLRVRRLPASEREIGTKWMQSPWQGEP